MRMPNKWIWLAVGAGGLAAVAGRKRHASSQLLLGSPIEVQGTPRVTTHGQFGTLREGPPVHHHQGVDLAAPAGSHALAVGDGTIVKTDPGLGKIVRKLHLDRPGAWTEKGAPIEFVVYADLGLPLVEPGARVRMGQPISLVAPAGFVHFAVKQRHASDEVFIDPARAGFAYRPLGVA